MRGYHGSVCTVAKQEHKKSLKTSIDWIMVKTPKNLEAFKLALEKEKINLVIRQNDNGIIYGLTYIDHKTKCVFNGSDIGKEYSAKSILAKCGIAQLIPNEEKFPDHKTSIKEGKETVHNLDRHPELKQNLSKALEVILSPEEANNYVPHELRKQKKKKRKTH